MSEKTLIVLIGNARGGEKTWETLYNNLVDVYNADLLLCFGRTNNTNNSLYKKAKYIIELEPDVKYTSVTTWIHEHFEKFDSDKIITKMMSGSGWKKGHKYWGMTPEQIKSQWNNNKDAVSFLRK